MMTQNIAGAKTHPVFSEKDYLDYERFAPERHEFLDGGVYAMAGESPPHSTICFNLYTIIGLQLRGKRCRGFSPNMKIATNERGMFAYPNLAVVCAPPVYHDDKGDVLTNPTAIFEVLSPSTEISGLDDTLQINSIECEIRLTEPYELVEFSA